MSAALSELRAALYTHFKANTGAGTVYYAVGGRYAAQVAPADIVWPYVLTLVVSASQRYIQDIAIDELRVQFSIFTQDDPDGASAETIGSLLRDCFDWCALSFTSVHTPYWMKPLEGGLVPLEDRRHQWFQDYEVAAQRAA